MKIRSKIFAIVGAVGVATAALCGMGLYAISQSRSMTNITNDHFTQVVATETMHRLVVNVAFNTRGTWMAKDAAEAKPYAEKMQGDLAEIERVAAKVHERLANKQEQLYFDTFLSAW